jgi:hypothetical protein
LFIKSVIRFEIAAAYLAELRTEDDELEGPAHSAFASLEPRDHGVEERLVGKLDGSTERVPEQLATELAEEVILATREEIIPQAVQAVDSHASREHGAGIDVQTSGVFGAGPTDGIKAFQGKTKRVHALVASRARRVAAMLFNQLTLGEALRRGLGQDRNVLGRTRKLIT